MPSALPAELQHQKYLSMGTFRKNGLAVQTPVWFAEQDGKIYAMTRNDSGKFKRIRNNPTVRVAPSTIRGRLIGPEFPGQARVLPADAWRARRTLRSEEHWLMR